MSPILFILYIGSLYEKHRVHGIMLVCFSDDTNIISIGSQQQNSSKQPGRRTRLNGMHFHPEKSELIHFSRTRTAPQAPIRLGPATVTPTESARFLGVWLHRKLKWKAHLEKLEAKLERQCRALTGIAASTWGCSLARAREVYTKVIRTALDYEAPAFHTPTEPRGNPKGVARILAKQQSQCLRTVLGAYRATPTAQLETEAAVLPLDIYLNSRVAVSQS